MDTELRLLREELRQHKQEEALACDFMSDFRGPIFINQGCVNHASVRPSGEKSAGKHLQQRLPRARSVAPGQNFCAECGVVERDFFVGN